jgi:glycerol dehydrogenase
MHQERDRTPRLVDAGKQAAPGCGIGLGGGKTLDTAKAVHAHFAVSLVISAMTGSTDAPTWARAIIHNDRCGALRYVFY